MFCQACGASNTPDARFCNRCGATIARAGAPGGPVPEESGTTPKRPENDAYSDSMSDVSLTAAGIKRRSRLPFIVGGVVSGLAVLGVILWLLVGKRTPGPEAVVATPSVNDAGEPVAAPTPTDASINLAVPGPDTQHSTRTHTNPAGSAPSRAAATPSPERSDRPNQATTQGSPSGSNTAAARPSSNTSSDASGSNTSSGASGSNTSSGASGSNTSSSSSSASGASPDPRPPAAPGTSASNEELPEENSVTMNLYTAHVRQLVRQYYGTRAQRCFESASRNGSVSGTVQIALTIGVSGSVSATSVARNTTNNERLGGCLASEVRTWRFSAPPGGEALDLVLPFNK